MEGSAGWLVAVMALIALAFGVIVWRLWTPGRKRELDRDANLPLEDTGESDLD